MNSSRHYNPFRLPAEFWLHSRKFVFLLTLNGLARALVVAGIYHTIRHLVSGLQRPDAPLTSLWFLLLLAAGLLLARLHERYTAARMSQNYINRLRRRLLARLMRASIRDVNAMSSGALAARLGGDLSSLRRWLSLGLSRLIVNTIFLAAGVVLITRVNLMAGLVASVVILLLTAVSLTIGERLRAVLKAVRSTRIRIQSLLVERIGEMAMIRVMGQEGREIRKVNRLGKKLERQASEQGLYLGGLRGLGEAGGILLIVSVFSVFHFSDATMTAAQAAAVISLIMFMTGPIRELGRVQEYYRGAAISLDKLSELFSMRRITRGASRFVARLPHPGTISFKQVSCAPAIRNFSGKVAAGEHVAVIGHNGSGKSTLLQLATGLLKPESGIVRLGGVSPRRLAPETRAKTIGVSGSGFGLLRGSLRLNLAYRSPKASATQLSAAVERFDLKKLVESFERGYANRIDQGARNISAGECARVALARATLGNPDILLLDEPESNLDAAGLTLLHDFLQSWPGTVLLITHKTSLIKLCHRVWDMDAEKVNNHAGNVSELVRAKRP